MNSSFTRTSDGSHLGRVRWCHWRKCASPIFLDLPVCRMHAMEITDVINQYRSDVYSRLMTPDPDSPPLEHNPQRWVYYLMVGPSTVKIGTTRDLKGRLNALRTDRQYIVALERGDMTLERQRHKEFAAERIGRREDFQLSERLKQHIGALQTDLDELLRMAV